MPAPQPPAVPGRPTIDNASALNPMLRPMSSGPAPAVPAAARAAIARSRVPLKCGREKGRGSIFSKGCCYICPSLGLILDPAMPHYFAAVCPTG
eukprot:scaffold15305_cov116-Isochrysis_galbana.AAC.8